jgi:hypothetical protein
MAEHHDGADAAAPMMERRRDVGEGHKALYDGYSPTRPPDRVGVAEETDIGAEGNVEMGRQIAGPSYPVAERSWNVGESHKVLYSIYSPTVIQAAEVKRSLEWAVLVLG